MYKVYIAGPYTKGDVAVNVHQAIEMSNRLFTFGLYPYVPHLAHFWHMLFPRPYEDWLRLDMMWLEQCDVLFRLEGESIGADKEVRRAEELGLPVFTSVRKLLAWAKVREAL